LIGEDDDGSGMERDDIYLGSREEVVLISLSDSYSKLNVISVGASGPSSSPT